MNLIIPGERLLSTQQFSGSIYFQACTLISSFTHSHTHTFTPISWTRKFRSVVRLPDLLHAFTRYKRQLCIFTQATQYYISKCLERYIEKKCLLFQNLLQNLYLFYVLSWSPHSSTGRTIDALVSLVKIILILAGLKVISRRIHFLASQDAND